MGKIYRWNFRVRGRSCRLLLFEVVFAEIIFRVKGGLSCVQEGLFFLFLLNKSFVALLHILRFF